MNILSVADLKAKLDQGERVLLLDLQSPEAYRHRHIPGAVQFDEHSHLPAEEPLVVYGEFDELGKGSAAAEKLEAQGFTNVSRLAGGLMGWMEAGHPVEGGQDS